MKPSKILVCILATYIVLGAVCLLFAGRSEVVRVPSLSSVFADILPKKPCATDSIGEITDLADTIADLSDVSDTIPAAPAIADTIRKAPVELPQPLPQGMLNLPLFYAALQHADKQPVRIVHIGDSQIEEDRISMIIRRRLQDKFGGGGIGLVPMVQTIPTYTAAQSIEQNGRPLPYTYVKRYVAYGPSSMRIKDGNYYGPMAQVAYINEPIDVSIELLRDRVPTYSYDMIRVLYSDSIDVTIIPDSIEKGRTLASYQTDTLTERMRQLVIRLDSLRRSNLIRLSGDGYVYGLSLETSSGVQVDNIPMRGAAGTNFTLMAREPFTAYFRETGTRLLIMQFGGNAMPSIKTHYAVDRYVESMRTQIHHLLHDYRDASLLFIGPADMITVVDGEQMTYPMLPYLDQQLQQMVEEEGGAYYSLFRKMGGAGSMIAWKEKGLAGEDMIHFTRAGAKKVGEMLAKQLIEDYDLYVESRKPKAENPDTTESQPAIEATESIARED